MEGPETKTTLSVEARGALVCARAGLSRGSWREFGGRQASVRVTGGGKSQPESVRRRGIVPVSLASGRARREPHSGSGTVEPETLDHRRQSTRFQ